MEKIWYYGSALILGMISFFILILYKKEPQAFNFYQQSLQTDWYNTTIDSIYAIKENKSPKAPPKLILKRMIPIADNEYYKQRTFQDNKPFFLCNACGNASTKVRFVLINKKTFNLYIERKDQVYWYTSGSIHIQNYKGEISFIFDASIASIKEAKALKENHTFAGDFLLNYVPIHNFDKISSQDDWSNLMERWVFSTTQYPTLYDSYEAADEIPFFYPIIQVPTGTIYLN